MIGEIYIYTNGVLLSRRLITAEDGTPITRSDLSNITLNIYKLTPNGAGYTTRTLQSSSTLTVNEVITESVQTDAEGRKYNFRYCVEGVFTQSNTLYLVEYVITTLNGHKIVVVAKGRTLD